MNMLDDLGLCSVTINTRFHYRIDLSIHKMLKDSNSYFI